MLQADTLFMGIVMQQRIFVLIGIAITTILSDTAAFSPPLRLLNADRQYSAQLSNTGAELVLRLASESALLKGEAVQEFVLPQQSPVEQILFHPKGAPILLLQQGMRLLLYHKSGDTFQQIEQHIADLPPGGRLGFVPMGTEVFWHTDRAAVRWDWQNKQSPRAKTILDAGENKIAGKGKITSLIPTQTGGYAYTQEGSWEIFVLPKNAERYMLSEHRAEVLALATDQNGGVYAIDAQGYLSVWHINKGKPEAWHALPFPAFAGTLEAFLFDPIRNKFFVAPSEVTLQNKQSVYSFRPQSQDSTTLGFSAAPGYGSKNGQIFQISIGLGTSKNLDSSGLLPDRSSGLDSAQYRPEGRKTSPSPASLYQLAQDAAQEEDWKKALAFLERVLPESADYRPAQQLETQIRKRLDAEKLIRQAAEYLGQDNFSAARSVLEEALRKDPENTRIQAYLESIDQRNRGFSLLWLLAALALGTAGSGYFFRKTLKQRWAQVAPHFLRISLLARTSTPQQTPQTPTEQARRAVQMAARSSRSGHPAPSDTEDRPAKPDSQKQARRHKSVLDVTQVILANSMALDTGQLYAKSWRTIAQKIQENTAAARSSAPDWDGLCKDLLELQQVLTQLSGACLHAQREASKDLELGIPQHYEILGVHESASPAEIKRMYLQKMKDYHPDRHQSSEFAWIKEISAQHSQQIQEAYGVLSDPQKRATYDRTLRQAKSKK